MIAREAPFVKRRMERAHLYRRMRDAFHDEYIVRRCRDERSSIMRAGLLRMTMSDRFLDRSVMHMHEPLILVLLCQRGEIAVDLVRLATGSSHLNRQMVNAEIGADFSADGVKQVIGQG